MSIARLLDDAANAAWDCRGHRRAIDVAQAVIDAAPHLEARTALTLWSRAAGHDGPTEHLTTHLMGRYRNAGDIALSLMRAALIAETQQPGGSR